MDKQGLAIAQKKMLGDLESVKRRLQNLPNVLAVGIGLKETGGQFTDEIAFRVFVTKKVDPSQLTEKELVPTAIDEFKTDVLPPFEVVSRFDVCGNERRTLATHRPLQAGIAVSTKTNSYGTLGWFATLDADDTTLILSNKHVFWDDTDAVETDSLPTAQPQLDEPSTCCCCECGSDNVIGETLLGVRNMSPPTDTSVDAAIARINSEFASDISLTITNDSTDEVLTVSGTAAASVGETVRKIGARSAFTRGTVVHIGDAAAAPPDPGGGTINIRTGQVLVIPAAGETYELRDGSGTCKRAFSNSGDSGSVVINDSDEIVALLYGGDANSSSVDVTFASNIDDVLSAMSSNGFPITLRTSPGDGREAYERSDAVAETHRRRRAVVSAGSLPEPNIFERLRDSNRASLLAFIYERHHREVLELVNHKRPATVAWHRAQGPAYIAALSRAGRVENYRVPFEVNGVSRRQLLEIMERVLLAHGSEDLKVNIARYRDELTGIAEHGETLQELALGLKARGFLDVVPSADRQAETGT